MFIFVAIKDYIYFDHSSFFGQLLKQDSVTVWDHIVNQ